MKQTEGPAHSDTLSQGHAELTRSVAAIVVQKLEHIDSSLEKKNQICIIFNTESERCLWVRSDLYPSRLVVCFFLFIDLLIDRVIDHFHRLPDKHRRCNKTL